MLNAENNIKVNCATTERIAVILRTDGVVDDASALPLRFVIFLDNEEEIVIVPGPHPNNPLGREVVITKEHAAQLGKRPRTFMLLNDETDDAEWTGLIVAEGRAV